MAPTSSTPVKASQRSATPGRVTRAKAQAGLAKFRYPKTARTDRLHRKDINRVDSLDDDSVVLHFQTFTKNVRLLFYSTHKEHTHG